jgi:hypothetical protein
MFNAHLLKIFYKDTIALFCMASLAISAPSPSKITAPLRLTLHTAVLADKTIDSDKTEVYMKTRLWRYLRKGINYLEASGKEVQPYFMHPGKKAYGPLALTPVAISDVKKHYPGLKNISTEEVLLDKDLYEKFAFAYADLLLRHYIKADYFKMDKEQVFTMLEKAWFLGPTLYKKGHPVIESRELKAKEYLTALHI